MWIVAYRRIQFDLPQGVWHIIPNHVKHKW